MDPITDRSWMSRRIVPTEIGASMEFVNGVQKFVDFAFQHPTCVNIQNHIRCPCKKCKNKNYRDPDDVIRHLCLDGFMKDYVGCWWAHGEVFSITGTQEQSQNRDTYRMEDMVRDVAGHDFDWDRDLNEPMNADAADFYKLLEEGREPLWSGCTKHSTLSAVSTLLNIKSDHNMSNECFESLLRAIKSMLPVGETLPNNLYYCKKMMGRLGLGYQKIDACVNNCILYYKENAELTQCTVCGHDRYKPTTGRDHKKKVNIPNKVLRYFPLMDRLKRLYLSSTTAKHMTWHAKNPGQDGELRHPSDGQAWKHFDQQHPEFAREPRNVRLGLSTDGFNPFGQSSVPYSCWPVIVTPYNLPPDMCMKQPYMFLSLLIPGPTSPGRELDVYMRPLIDELKDLWEVGVQTWDISTRSTFILKASLMWTISDFPAYGMLSGWSTHGRLSCPYCMEHSKAFYLPHGKKICHFDCHRRFLASNHPFRKNRVNFRRGKTDHDLPAPRLSGEEVRDRVMNLADVPLGRGTANSDIPGFKTAHNWKKRSIFWELPYWPTNLIRHNLDVMHIEKNVFDNVFNTVMDVKGRTKDNVKARMDMKEICKRPELELYESTAGTTVKPHAKYTLSKRQIDDVCGWIQTLKLPDGYASNIARCVGRGKMQGMKSHDAHVFMERLLPIAWRDLLDKNIWDVLAEFSRFFKDLCAKVLYEKDLVEMQVGIVEIICKLEKIFPPSFFDSMEHLPIHLVYEAMVGGPVTYRWMYAFERFMGILKNKVKNNARVEGSIAESYIHGEISTFMSDFFPDEVLTKANRRPRNDDGGDVELNGRVSIFGYPGQPHGKSTRILISEELCDIAHTYILLNCPEMDNYVSKFDVEVRLEKPDITEKELDALRQTNFQKWLKRTADNDDNFPKDVYALAMGPNRYVHNHNGFKVNGFDFHTKQFSRGKQTTNYGICVRGEFFDATGGDYYGELEDIYEFDYRGAYGGKVYLFMCRWFDSEKGIRVDRHGIIDVDVSRKTYEDQPFVLPTQTTQVYYTAGTTKKRDRSSANWQVVIHTPARMAPQGQLEDAYQENQINTSPRITHPDTNIQINLRGGGDDEDVDVNNINEDVQLNESEEEFISDDETEEEDGWSDTEENSDRDDTSAQ